MTIRGKTRAAQLSRRSVQNLHGRIWAVAQEATAFATTCEVCGVWLAKAGSQIEAEEQLLRHLKSSHKITSPKFSVDPIPRPLFVRVEENKLNTSSSEQELSSTLKTEQRSLESRR